MEILNIIVILIMFGIFGTMIVFFGVLVIGAYLCYKDHQEKVELEKMEKKE